MCPTPFHSPAAGLRRGFTLIEILIVVIILGILAGIVFPQFSNASHVARENTLKEDLRYMRTQILAFRLQHRDINPGYPNGDTTATPTADDFVNQMTKYSDDSFNLSATAGSNFPHGPYLSTLPNNPLSTSTGLWVVTGSTMPAPDAGQPYGWIYNPTLQRFIANLPGSDADGVPYSSY